MSFTWRRRTFIDCKARRPEYARLSPARENCIAIRSDRAEPDERPVWRGLTGPVTTPRTDAATSIAMSACDQEPKFAPGRRHDRFTFTSRPSSGNFPGFVAGIWTCRGSQPFFEAGSDQHSSWTDCRRQIAPDAGVHRGRTMKALDYHEATNHSWARMSADPHYLDFDNMPRPFKIYSDLPRTPLPTGWRETERSALSALAGAAAPLGDGTIPDLGTLAHLLSAVGITKRRTYPGGEMLYRGASCTGALYHIEAYVACADLEGVSAGLYQFQPVDFSFCRLRVGDFRQVLVEASGDHPEVAGAPAVLILTSTWWRNAWSTGRAPTGTPGGTRGACWRTSWRRPAPWACRPRWCSATPTRRSISCSTSTPKKRHPWSWFPSGVAVQAR